MLIGQCSCGERFRAPTSVATRMLICRRCGSVVQLRSEQPARATSRPAAARPSPGASPPARPRRRLTSIRGQRRADWWITVLSWSYLAVAGIAAAVLWGLSDRWWPATLLLFSGRWVLLLPLVVLAPAAALLRKPTVLPLAAAATVIVGPVMGLQVNWRPISSPPAGMPLRVVTLNAAGGGSIAPDLPALLEEWRAEIVAVQECGPELVEAVQALQGWHRHSHGGLCLVSRHPIRSAEVMDRSVLARIHETTAIGGAGAVVRYSIKTPGPLVRVTNLHLETPRKGIEALLARGPAELEANIQLRAIEARLARRWADGGEGPRLIVGDFNTPVESRIYRASWSDLTNAFSAAGRGLGATRFNGWIRVRIDHVLVDGGWWVRDARVGRDVGSDHRPVLADLVLRE